MNLTINQIIPQTDDENITSIVVYFTAQTEDGKAYISGNVSLDNINLIDLDGIKAEVKTELSQKIANGDMV